jgi:hypothetical protein
MFESFDVLCGSFRKRFNRSIRTIAYVADNLMSSCGALRKKSIPDPLNITTYQKLSRYTRHDLDLKMLLCATSSFSACPRRNSRRH